MSSEQIKKNIWLRKEPFTLLKENQMMIKEVTDHFPQTLFYCRRGIKNAEGPMLYLTLF